MKKKFNFFHVKYSIITTLTSYYDRIRYYKLRYYKPGILS